MKRLFAVVLTAIFLAPIAVAPLAAQAKSPPTPDMGSVTQKLMSKLQWRSIGPFIGGRVVAIAGVPSQPSVFYMGGVQGGVWRSSNYGMTWDNITDGQSAMMNGYSIGALAVAPSNPKVIYAGTGESDPRGDFATGDGIYKTTDAGKTWHYAGLRDTHTTTALAIDPRDPNVAYASSLGHVFAPNAERGVFKTTDGGATWSKVLFVDDNTGSDGVVMDARNPNVLYASMWQASRKPWNFTSGGPGSGLYKTSDGGAHWSKISDNPGFAQGVLGKIGVSVSATDPRSVYAIVQAQSGGVFHSNDGGATWKRVNAEMKLRQRAFYYTAIYADPTNAKVAYAPQVDGVFKTTDSGKTWKAITRPGDHHIIWINPRNPKILLEGDDGGAMVSVDGGKTWSSKQNQPTDQFYKVAIDKQFPFHVYGASQDHGAFEGPTASQEGLGHRRVAQRGAGREHLDRARSQQSERHVRQRLPKFDGAFRSRDGRAEERQSVAQVHVGRRVVGEQIPLRLDASDLFLAVQTARTAGRGQRRLQERRLRRALAADQPRSHAQRSEHRRPDRRADQFRSNRRRDVSGYFVARRFAVNART